MNEYTVRKTVRNLIFLIGFLFLIYGCATKPGPNLAFKAVLIQPEKTTKEKVLKLLGPPAKVSVAPDGVKELYYYHKVKNFWEKIPVIKRYAGENYTEVLKVVIKGKKVIDRLYYTVSSSEKK